MSDKQSQAKIDLLRALGAEVYVCPTNVEPEDPRSYYSIARRLEKEIPNSIYLNQYDNLSNTAAHYDTTAPEIWEQTEGKITHLVAGVGTGGTISGTGKFLKERNPNIRVIGADTYGSVFKKLKETGIFDKNEIYPYATEGIGEDILPKNVNLDVIDEFIKVTDKDAAIMARRLAREEGLLIGWSCGSAMWAALEYAKEHLTEDDVMVVILPDHGTRYLSKIYNDTWMRERGFVEEHHFATAKDIVKARNNNGKLLSINKQTRVSDAIGMMSRAGISQLPVSNGDDEIVGSITDASILAKLVQNPEIRNAEVGELMDKPFPVVAVDNTIDVLSSILKDSKALLVRDEQNLLHIITQQDLLLAMTKQ